MYQKFLFILSIVMLLVTSCKDAAKGDVVQEEENLEAKKMLQGIWLDEEDGEVTMKVRGDSIAYADSTMSSVSFRIIGDSLVLKGYTEAKYAVVRQTENVFQFRNHNGDIVKYVKSTDTNDNYVFMNRKHAPLNQNQLIKRDTVVFVGEHKYHVYIQINPSKYKVISTTYNDDGMQMDNVYYDNIINVCVYDGGRRLYSHDIRKQDLKEYVPQDFLEKSVLSDINYDKAKDDGVELLASVCVPDSPSYYVVRMSVAQDGTMKLSKE